MLLEDGQHVRAASFAESILDYDPECGDAYAIRLLATMHLRTLSDLAFCQLDFTDNRDFARARKFAGSELAQMLDSAKKAVFATHEAKAKTAYEEGRRLLSTASNSKEYRAAAKCFASAEGYADATSALSKAVAKVNEPEAEEETVREETYRLANRMMLGLVPGGLVQAAELFESLGPWKDSAAQAEECRLRKWENRFMGKEF